MKPTTKIEALLRPRRLWTLTRMVRALALSALVLSAAPALAQPAPQPDPAAQSGAPQPTAPTLPPEVSGTIERVVTAVDSAEKSLERMKGLDDDIGRVRDEVEAAITTSTAIADELRPRLADLRSQIERLGPAPARDAPPEAPAIAAERAKLAAEAVAIDGAIKTLELTWVRARQAIDRIVEMRLAFFRQSLLERMASPLLPALWFDAWRDSPWLTRFMSYVATEWWRAASAKLDILGLIAIVAAAIYFAGRMLVGRVVASRRAGGSGTPSFLDRAAAASWTAPARALPGAAAALLIYGALDFNDLLYFPSDRMAAAALRGLLIFIAVRALIVTVLEPGDATQRLIPLADHSARRISLILQAITAVYAADLALSAIGRALFSPISMTVVQAILTTAAFSALVVGLLVTPFDPLGQAKVSSRALADRASPRWLKVPLWIAVGAILVALVLGYVALGRFIAQQIVMTGVVAMIATLLVLAIRAFTREPTDTPHRVGRMLEARFGLDAPRRQQLAWLTEAALTLTVLILVLPVLLLQWGLSGAEIRDWLKAAVFGFEVGQFRISLARILIGVVLFTALLFATRLIQRWLRDRVLGPQRIDAGIANSIDTAVGYAGTILAAILAISYAGFDITNLAIVAGALSVGIGFGLQSIVNNFVSGLILLIERPIKVGDWIVVGSEQGNVRRVSVRSTEIETFDKASLIVPNSELITGRVLNWTHRNTLGRVMVKVTISSDQDPRRVAALLTACAKANPMLLSNPEPRAYLDSLGPGPLEYSVRGYIADVNTGLEAQSELRIAILLALREAGIPTVEQMPMLPIAPAPEHQPAQPPVPAAPPQVVPAAPVQSAVVGTLRPRG